MNGADAATVASISVTNPIIQVLENIIAQVRAGAVTSIAVVTVAPNRGITPFLAGPQLCELQTGGAIISATALHHLMNPQQPSRILRPM